MSTVTELNDLGLAYVEALYFTDCGPDSDIPAGAQLSPEAHERIADDCARFQALAADLIPHGCRRNNEYSDYQQAGHDFWLTRNGHGCGFWDGDWPEVGDKLTAIAKQFPEVTAYLGDDGLIYLA